MRIFLSLCFFGVLSTIESSCYAQEGTLVYNKIFEYPSAIANIHELNDTLNAFMWFDGCAGFQRFDTLGGKVSEYTLNCESNSVFVRGLQTFKYMGGNRYYAAWGALVFEPDESIHWDFWVTRFNLNGSIEMMKQYDFDKGNDGVNALIVSDNESFIIAGSSNGEFDNKRATLKKCDSSGEILWQWQKEHYQDGLSKFKNVDTLLDGRIVASGQAYYPTTGLHENYVALFDANGNLLWEKHIGDSSIHKSCRVVPRDGNLLLIGKNGLSVTNESGVPYLAWLDYDGNVIDDNIFGNDAHRYIGWDVSIYENDRILTGLGIVDEDLLAQTRILTYDYDGENLEEHVLIGEEGFHHYTFDFIESANGGYYSSGMIEGSGQQKAWLVKMDQHFAAPSTPNTDSLIVQTSIGIDKPIEFAHSLSPNPAKDIVSLKYPNPLFVNFSYLKLYNEQGQQVFEQKLEAWESEWTIDISHLSSGLYFYDIRTERKQLASGKILVE